MTKLSSEQIQSASAIPTGSILVKDAGGNRRSAVAWDVTTLGVGGSSIEKIESFICGENISIDDHVSLSYYKEEQADSTDIIKTYNTTGAAVTIDYGEAFNRPVSSPIQTITPSIRLSTLNESGGSAQTFSYSLQCKIYAITGSVGSSAVNTGPALLTSTNTVSGTLQFTNILTNPVFNFDGVTILSAGSYAVKVEGSISGTPFIANGLLRVRGDNTGAYSGNAIDSTTAVSGEDMSFTIISNRLFVVRSNANDADKLAYRGQSTENKLVGESILVKTRGLLNVTGATNESQIWYLSNTPGQISTTAGTNRVYVGRGYSTDIVNIRGLSDFSLPDVSYSNQSFSGLSGSNMFYVAGGGILNFGLSLSLGGASFTRVSYEISTDGVSWVSIGSNTIYTSTPQDISQNSISIPGNNFFRFLHTSDGTGGSTISNINLIIF